MRLLILTQKVDSNDSVLGFFHWWLDKLSYNFESVDVVCLEKGNFDLPENVRVHSLGKEQKKSKILYLKNFFKHLNNLSGSYDAVFVHMNQEYVILGGLYWMMKGIPVYLWRNHPKGDFWTHIALFFSKKSFCTSTDSFITRFKKTTIMPVGVNTDIFKPVNTVVRKKYSVCMVGRVSPIKNIDIALKSILSLVRGGAQVNFGIIGHVPEKDYEYGEELKDYVLKNNLGSVVSFLDGVSYDKTPNIFNSYEICLNLTESGSFDKTIVEASSCGTIPIVSNKSLVGMLPEVCITNNDPESIAESIKVLLNPHEQIKIHDDLRKFADSHSLDELIKKLVKEIK